MKTELPQKTADYTTLPDGTRVWVQTLNTYHRDDADRMARRRAALMCTPLLKGGEDYPGLLASLKGLSPESQARHVASAAFFDIREQAAAAYPELSEPEQGEQEPHLYAAALEAWRVTCEANDKKRREMEEERMAAEEAAALALTAKKRLDACVAVSFAREFGEVYAARMEIEALYRAVRQAEEHSTRFFTSVQEVEDLDDATRHHLAQFYTLLDSVDPRAVPTTPPA